MCGTTSKEDKERVLTELKDLSYKRMAQERGADVISSSAMSEPGTKAQSSKKKRRQSAGSDRKQSSETSVEKSTTRRNGRKSKVQIFEKLYADCITGKKGSVVKPNVVVKMPFVGVETPKAEKMD
jgi:hypothetical protein